MAKKYRIALLHGAKLNAGDFLIKERAKKLILHEFPQSEFYEVYRNQKFGQEIIEEINACDIAILAGGPGYYDDFYPLLAPMVSDLEEIKVPIMMLGMGWFGMGNDPYIVYGYTFGEKMKKLLTRAQQDSGFLGCRDYNAVHVLRNNGFSKAIMTGCPAWYDLSKLQQTVYMGPRLQECRKICISDCGNSDNLENLVRLVEQVRHFFGCNAKISLVVHRDSGLVEPLKAVEEAYNVQVVDISRSQEGFRVYDDCDIHIGFRVHAHIYCLSERKMSILIEEDARGDGVNGALGLPHIKAYVTVENETLEHIPSGRVMYELMDYLSDLHESGYVFLTRAYENMCYYYRIMQSHIRMIPSIVESNKGE